MLARAATVVYLIGAVQQQQKTKEKKMQIDSNVLPRLERAIRELLAHGYTTGKVSDMLVREQSFGKYDGCTPAAILELANNICRACNAEARAAQRDAHAQLVRDIERDLPSLRRFIRGRL